MTETEAFAPTHDDYTDAELLEQAQGNARAAILATVAFLDERGVPLGEWAARIGRRFAEGWGDPEPWEANEFLDAMLTNLRSLGATVDAADLDDPDRATATVSGIFTAEECARFGTTRAAATHFLASTAEIATERDVAWSLTDTGEAYGIVVERRSAQP